MSGALLREIHWLRPGRFRGLQGKVGGANGTEFLSLAHFTAVAWVCRGIERSQ